MCPESLLGQFPLSPFCSKIWGQSIAAGLGLTTCIYSRLRAGKGALEVIYSDLILYEILVIPN